MSPHDAERREREFRHHIRESFREKEEDYRRRLADARAFFSGEPFKKADKLDRLGRFFRDRVGEMESWGDAALDDRMRAYLADCRALMNRFPAVFPKEPTADEMILRRLAGIGRYELVRDSRADYVDWSSPAGLLCDWCSIRLLFEVRADGDADEAYGEVLARWEEFRLRAVRLFDDLRHQVIRHFRSSYEEGRPQVQLEADGYLLDEEGLATVESILSGIGPLTVVLSNGLHGAAFRCAVPWDDEHGFEAEADERWHLRTD